MDDFGGLRQRAAKSDRARRRARRWTSVISTGFLALTMFALVVGLTLVTAAYGPRVGLQLPLEQMGLLGEIAATLAPPPADLNGSPSAGGLEAQATVVLPTPISTATLIPTATDTSTATPTFTPLYTDTPTPTSTPSSTPTVTPTPSSTPTPSETPSGTLQPTAIVSASPPPSATEYPDCSLGGNPTFESALLALVNEERESQGLPAYSQHSQLRAAARIHSTDMACSGIFSHTGSDGSSVGDRVTAEGYSWSSVDENIYATGNTSSQAPELAFDFWMASPPNQANILSEQYMEIGIGYIHVPGSPFGGYFTAVFAEP